MLLKVKIENIQWDTDGASLEDCRLPKKAEVTVDVEGYFDADAIKSSFSEMSQSDAAVLDEIVSEHLSDEYGYCLNSGSEYPEGGISILPEPSPDTPAP